MMSDRLDGVRVLIYSHDSFGLGHLRRCRAIAHSLVERFKGLTVLILSGSPIIGSFDFRARVDFVRVPGVIKLHNGEYTSLGLHIDLEQTLAIRASIIQHTARVFDPHLFLVDKEPLGLKGEVVDTLKMLKRQGAACVLGLRDVMDEPLRLRQEWRRKQVLPALERLYDQIWIYGLEQIANPLAGQGISRAVCEQALYTGYLPRAVPAAEEVVPQVTMDSPFLLVTVGGGGDGAVMIDWVLRAYETGADLPWPALVVLGPFMAPAEQKAFQERVAGLDRVRVTTFDAHLEMLMAKAAGVVAMGGYNTFCEILSLDKRALLVPRSEPRREQLIRARQADRLGLVRMLDADGDRHPGIMVRALNSLPEQRLPSTVEVPGLLSGLETINQRVATMLGAGGQPHRREAERHP